MALFTMVGVGVITRPPILTGQDAFDNDTLVGAGFAISSVFLDTFVVCIIRYLKVVHVSVMMLFLGFWGTIQSVVCAYSIGELRMPESGTDWGLAIALAAIALINQVAMNLALQFEQAGPVSVTRTMDFIFAFMLQFIWMGIVPDLFR
ncbi:unnamed protein product [Orchesella dallaii]|uniref:Uncharacterized protein n=1 Tax=Orchesella dallaii TaxID=48710 RepID=A0ABP1RFQ2_9HEXA